MLTIALVCLAIFLPICVLTPCYYADDGGYTQMLSYFMQTGKVDLMHWSQPTAIGLLLVASLIVKAVGLGFVQLDVIGLLFSISAVCGLYILLKRYLSTEMAFLISLSIFAFSEVTYVTPTFMTDIPFLSYCVWWLVLTDRILSEEGSNVWTYAGWFLFLLLAFLTRSTILLALPALLLSAALCTKSRKRILVLSLGFIGCWLLSVVSAKLLSINQLSFFDTTALREIVQLHDFARFNLRALAVATLTVVFALSPLLLVVKPVDNKLRIIQIGSAVLVAVLAVYFAHKQFFLPLGKTCSPIAIAAVTFAAFNIPVIVRESLRANKVLSVILITYAAAQFAVLPIMAHPLVRHVIPAMVMLTILAGIANAWRAHAFKILMLLSPFLIFCNVINLQQLRLIDFATLQFIQDLNRRGVSPQTIDAGWGWFCYTALVPGRNESQHYVERYKSWQSEAKYFVGRRSEEAESEQKPGTVLASVPVKHLMHSAEVVLVKH